MVSIVQNIINYISQAATNAGFASVEEYGFNTMSSADTLLPKLFIKSTGIRYDKQEANKTMENAQFDLIIIINNSYQPLTDLYNLSDALLAQLYALPDPQWAFIKKKFILKSSTLTNDRDIYAKFGGESLTLSVEIQNLNTFGAYT